MTQMKAYQGRDRVYAFADELQAGSAATTQGAEQQAVLETWVTFALAGETYAFPVEAIQEIVRVSTITRVPDAPHPVRGILNLRGRVVPVVDLRVRLGLPRGEAGARNRVLVATARGRLIGLLVDEVEQVVRLDRNAFEAPPADVLTERSDYLRAVCQRDRALLILLDVERVLEVSGE